MWFLASLTLAPLVIASAHHERDAIPATIAATIYVTIVCGLFGTSALYHRGDWGMRASRTMQRVDHAMIFLMIAGTATPVFLLAAPGAYGVACLIGLWVFTALALGVHLARMDAPERLVGAVFVGLGLTAGLAVPPLWIHRGVAAAVLMLAGGALYLLGALVYHRRKPDPSPTLFGYHEVFHAFVCGAATCQYIAIAVFVL